MYVASKNLMDINASFSIGSWANNIIISNASFSVTTCIDNVDINIIFFVLPIDARSNFDKACFS